MSGCSMSVAHVHDIVGGGVIVHVCAQAHVCVFSCEVCVGWFE